MSSLKYRMLTEGSTSRSYRVGNRRVRTNVIYFVKIRDFSQSFELKNTICSKDKAPPLNPPLNTIIMSCPPPPTPVQVAAADTGFEKGGGALPQHFSINGFWP